MPNPRANVAYNRILTRVANLDLDQRTDAELAERFARHRDEAAFEALLRRHGPMVWRLCRRLLRCEHDAEDVFQATFLVFARKAWSLRQSASVGPWLFGVASRLAARSRTSSQRRRDIEARVPVGSASSSDDVLASVSVLEAERILHEELARLPAKFRDPLVLCHLEGKARDEAARELGCALGTLKERLLRGKELLRARLARWGLGMPAALVASLLTETVSPAGVSETLLQTLIRSAIGPAGAAELSTPVAALVEAGVRGLGVTPAKLAACLAASALLVGSVIGWTVLNRAAAQPGPAATAADKQPAKEPGPTTKRPNAFDDPLPAGSTMRLGTSRFRPGGHIRSLAVSADGKTAFVGSLPYPFAFDLVSGRATFTIRHDAAESIAISPDGRTIVTKRELHLYICDSKTGKELRTIALPKNPWRDADVLVFTPDGKAVATISDGKAIHLIDFESGKTIHDFSPENPESNLPSSFQTVLGIAFSPDGKLMASGGFDNDQGNYFARLWDVDTGKELRRFVHGRSYGITSLAFSPDGKTLATGSDDARLRLFDVDTGNERKAFPKDSYGYRRGRGVAFAPDGKTVATSGTSIHLYDVENGEERLRIDRAASQLHFSDEGKTLIGAVGNAIYRWDTATGKALTPDAAGDSVVDQILVTSDGRRILTRGQGGDAHIWDGASGNHLRFLRTWRSAMALSPDDRYLAWAHYDNSLHIRLYDLAAGRFVERFPAFKGSSQVEATFTADGKTLITIEHLDGMVRLWNVETGKERRSFQALPDAEKNQTDRIRRVAISPDGATLAVATHQSREVRGMPHVEPPDTIRLWDVASGKELRQLEGYSSSMAFSPNGRLLVTSGAIWEVATGTRMAEKVELSPLIAFSCDGRSLATTGDGGTIRVLEFATWTERTRFKCAHEQTTSLAFTPAGQLLCGGLDTTVLAYDVRPRPGDASVTLEAAWNDLTQRDAGRAFQSQGRLLAAPSAAVKLLAEKIKAVKAADADHLRGLIAGLGDAMFAVREAASKALSELGEKARPALEEAARTSPSPEVAERAKKILGGMETTTPDQLRQRRAVEVLERIASQDAKNLLKQWAAGVHGAVLTEEARAALGRLERVAPRGPIGR